MAPSAQSAERRLAADAAAGAGDDAGAAGEPEVHQSASTRSVTVTEASPASDLVDGAVGGDRQQPLALLLVELGRQLRATVEGGRRVALVVDLDLDLERAEVPALALGVHLDRDRGAAGEAGGEQLGRAGAGVGAAAVGRLVDDQLVPAVELDLVGEALDRGGRRPSSRLSSLPRPSNRAGSSTSAKRAIA